MEAFILYLCGWIILSLGVFIYKIYNKDNNVNIKVYAWRAFWIGMWSWIGIFFISAFQVVNGIFLFNNWVEEKLNNN